MTPWKSKPSGPRPRRQAASQGSSGRSAIRCRRGACWRRHPSSTGFPADRDRVGVVGWSRGAYLAYYAITHPGNTKIGAAIVDDGFTSDYSLFTVHGTSQYFEIS